MKVRIVLSTLLGVLVLLLPLSLAYGDSPVPSIRQELKFEGFTLAGSYDVLQRVLTYAPGNTSAIHTHLGPVLGSVLEGSLTMRQEGCEMVYGAGQGFVETPGVMHSPINAGSVKTTLLVLNLIPKGQPARVKAQSKPSDPPDAISRLDLKLAGALAPGRYDAVQQVLDFAPGTSLPTQAVPGPVFTSVLEGEITLHEEGTEKVYTVDQGWIEKAGVNYSVGNASNVKTSLLVGYVVPAGTLVLPVAPMPTEGTVWSVVFSPDGEIVIAPTMVATTQSCLSATMGPATAMP